MLTHQNAEIYFKNLLESSCTSLRKHLFKAALQYAPVRAKWDTLTSSERSMNDSRRTSLHNAFISACNALCREQVKQGENTHWRKALGDNRKTIGDFACYIHLFLSLKNR